ncbi:hypothetical protein ACWFRJ_43375 [Streptomyces sp. NPDC055239]
MQLTPDQASNAVERHDCATCGASGPSGTTYDDFPKPEYVTDAPISAGDCSHGKIVYSVPGKQHPDQALYTTDDEPTLRWSLAK